MDESKQFPSQEFFSAWKYLVLNLQSINPFNYIVTAASCCWYGCMNQGCGDMSIICRTITCDIQVQQKPACNESLKWFSPSIYPSHHLQYFSSFSVHLAFSKVFPMTICSMNLTWWLQNFLITIFNGLLSCYGNTQQYSILNVMLCTSVQ